MAKFEHWNDVIEFEQHEQEERKLSVVVEYEGMEYRVLNRDGAEMLIDATEPQAQVKNKIRLLDIKGLGLLSYRSRSIISMGRHGGLEYRMVFEQAYHK